MALAQEDAINVYSVLPDRAQLMKTFPGWQASGLSWGPGTLLAFQAVSGVVLDTQTGTFTELRGNDLVFSPSSGVLAFNCWLIDCGVETWDPTTGATSSSRSTWDQRSISWDPTSQEVGAVDGDSQVFWVSQVPFWRPGKRVAKSEEIGANATNISWSGLGGEVAFTTWDAADSLTSPMTLRSTPVVLSSSVRSAAPVARVTNLTPPCLDAWSPDGATIAFTSSSDAGASVYLLPASSPPVDVSQLTPVASYQEPVAQIAWTPDSAQLMALATSGSDGGAFEVDLLHPADGGVDVAMSIQGNGATGFAVHP